MSVDRLAFNHEDYIRKCIVVYYLAHVHNQAVNSFTVYFVFLEFAYVQDADVVQPLAAIKAAKNK